MGRGQSGASGLRMNGGRGCAATQICVYLVVHLWLNRLERKLGGCWDFFFLFFLGPTKLTQDEGK